MRGRTFADGGYEPARRGRLSEVSGSARSEHGGGDLLLVVHGQANDPQPGQLTVNQASCLYATQLRHVHVHNHHIWLQLEDHLDGLEAIGDLMHYLDVCLQLQQVGQTLSYD